MGTTECAWQSHGVATGTFLDARVPRIRLMVVHAIYENGVFRPTEPIELPERCQVELLIHQPIPTNSRRSPEAPLAQLAALAAAHPENPELPIDLAAQHDHYLYGSARSE
jgi:predicted DNA-binding antitoxin AbrB/MazE fold protein